MKQGEQKILRNLKELQDELDRHNTYRGIVSDWNFGHLTMADVAQQIVSDWNFGHLTMADVAQQIVSDWNFDRVCKIQCEVRDKKYELKKLSKEVLNDEN